MLNTKYITYKTRDNNNNRILDVGGLGHSLTDYLTPLIISKIFYNITFINSKLEVSLQQRNFDIINDNNIYYWNDFLNLNYFDNKINLSNNLCLKNINYIQISNSYNDIDIYSLKNILGEEIIINNITELDKSIDNNIDIELDKSIDNNNIDIELDKSIDNNIDIKLDKSIDNNIDIKLDKSIDNNIDIELDKSIDNNIDIELDKSIDDNNIDIELDKSIDNNNIDIKLDKSIDNNIDIELDKSIDDNNIDIELDKSIDNNIDIELDKKNNIIYCFKNNNRIYLFDLYTYELNGIIKKNITKDIINNLRNAYFSKHIFKKNDKKIINIYIRKGDLYNIMLNKNISNDYYNFEYIIFNYIYAILSKKINFNDKYIFNILSAGNKLEMDEIKNMYINYKNINFIFNEPEDYVFKLMVQSDILIFTSSSFPFTASLYTDGIIIKKKKDYYFEDVVKFKDIKFLDNYIFMDSLEDNFEVNKLNNLIEKYDFN